MYKLFKSNIFFFIKDNALLLMLFLNGPRLIHLTFFYDYTIFFCGMNCKILCFVLGFLLKDDNIFVLSCFLFDKKKQYRNRC